jgi:membrane-associated phospholipid phosphatase
MSGGTDSEPELPSAAEAERRATERFKLSRRGWAWVLTAAGAAWCSALLLWAQHGIDEALVRHAAGLDARGLAIGLARVASLCGMAAIAVIHLVGLAVSVFGESWRRHRNVYILTLLSLAIAGIAGDLLKELVDRPRPSVVYSALSFAAGESTTAAFPSGHSTKSLALALPFLLFVRGWGGRRGLVKLALAALALSVCASRVVLGAHFLSDVVGGLAMALSGLPLAVMASNFILGRMTPSDLDRAGRIGVGVYAVLIVILLKLS